MENSLLGQDDSDDRPQFWCHICRVSCVSAVNLQSHFLGSRHKKAEKALKNIQDGQDDSEDPPPYWCHICRVSCASAVNLQSHFLGSRHKKAEEALKNIQDVDEQDVSKPGESLADQINACKNTEPALGLEYIYEFQNYGYSRYECKLCNCFLGRTHMFMHIVGAKHRMYYLNKHHPSLGTTNAYTPKGQKKLKKLREICMKVENDFGRKQINVVKEDGGTSYFCNASPHPAYVTNQSERKLQRMDFTNDDFMDNDCRSKDKEHVSTFLELKVAYEASLKNQTVGQENILQPVATVQEIGGEGKKESNPDNDDSESDEDISSMETSADIEDLTSNKGLFEFLENFKVLEIGDVHFLLKVSEKLKYSLFYHLQFCQKDAEKSKIEFKTNKEDRSINQSVEPCIKQPFTNQDPTTESYPIKVLSSDQICKENPTTKPPASPGTGIETHQTRQHFSSLQQSNYETKGSSKKLSFRISGLPTEKNPLVSSQLLMNMQQDFAAQGTRNKLVLSPTHFDDKDLNEDATSVKPVYGITQDVLKPWNSSSEPRNRHLLPDIDAAKTIGDPYWNEHLKGSSCPPQLSGYPAGFDRTRALHLQESSQNFASVSSSTAHDRREQIGNNNCVFPCSKPNAHESIRKINSSHDIRNTVNSFERNSAGPPLFRAPFNKQLTPAPRASPQLFPVAKDDVTAKFFESLKDMEVSEVVSTLNKITANNPALQGIHVPSLVQYLMDTGKLKPPSSKQPKL